MSGSRDPDRRFDDALREWSTRPSRQTARDAALGLAEEIGARRSPRLTPWPAMVAAAAVLALAVAITATWRTAVPVSSVESPGLDSRGGLAEGVVLMWIDEETPLYMTFQAPRGAN